MRSVISAAVLALLPLSIVVSASTSSEAAAEGGSISARNVVLYTTCPNYEYGYNVVLPEWAVDWDMQVTLYGRDGLSAGSDYVSGPTSGVSEALACLEPGRYTIEAMVDAYDEYYNEYSFQLAPKSFTVRKARSRTTLQVSNNNPSRGDVVTMRGTVKDERPRGYFPTDFAKVVLEVYRAGRWQVSRGIYDYSNNRGRVVLKGRYLGEPISIRLRTKSDDSENWAGSVSRKVRLR
ncbi:hypothetical protein [Nocardioides dongxiaopingii]|uniref:hypothetical protein n=1 Tax=Nocardioides dongxiaopingii TaxID=2576036 RepID=UPI0010C76CBE|nr:hypothetical protein [Nocardioides dongxiaopingii]